MTDNTLTRGLIHYSCVRLPERGAAPPGELSSNHNNNGGLNDPAKAPTVRQLRTFTDLCNKTVVVCHAGDRYVDLQASAVPVGSSSRQLMAQAGACACRLTAALRPHTRLVQTKLRRGVAGRGAQALSSIWSYGDVRGNRQIAKKKSCCRRKRRHTPPHALISKYTVRNQNLHPVDTLRPL